LRGGISTLEPGEWIMPIEPVDPYIVPSPPPEQVTIEGSRSEQEPPPESSSTSVKIQEEDRGQYVDITV